MFTREMMRNWCFCWWMINRNLQPWGSWVQAQVVVPRVKMPFKSCVFGQQFWRNLTTFHNSHHDLFRTSLALQGLSLLGLSPHTCAILKVFLPALMHSTEHNHDLSSVPKFSSSSSSNKWRTEERKFSHSEDVWRRCLLVSHLAKQLHPASRSGLGAEYARLKPTTWATCQYKHVCLLRSSRRADTFMLEGTVTEAGLSMATSLQRMTQLIFNSDLRKGTQTVGTASVTAIYGSTPASTAFPVRRPGVFSTPVCQPPKDLLDIIRKASNLIARATSAEQPVDIAHDVWS